MNKRMKFAELLIYVFIVFIFAVGFLSYVKAVN